MTGEDCGIACRQCRRMVMADGFQKRRSFVQTPALVHPRQILMEAEMSVRSLTTAGNIRERAGFSSPALPILVHRTHDLRRALLAQTLVALVHRINKHGKVFVAQFMVALRETRRREAIRTIHRYRHLIQNGKCDG